MSKSISKKPKSSFPITTGYVEERIKEIVAKIHDPEMAHNYEDAMAWDIIEAIATGNCVDARGCCREALKSQALDFARWLL